LRIQCGSNTSVRHKQITRSRLLLQSEEDGHPKNIICWSTEICCKMMSRLTRVIIFGFCRTLCVFIDTAQCPHSLCIIYAYSGIYETVERSSVCPIDRPQQRPPAGLLLSAPRAGDRSIASASAQQQQHRSTALSSKRGGQCHADSRRRRLNTYS